MKKFLAQLALLFGCLVVMMPLYWTVVTSLKTQKEIAQDPSRMWPQEVTFENFGGAWNALPFANFLLNTVFVTLVATTGTLLTGSLVAYSFARFQFRGRNAMFAVLLSTMMLPGQVTMIPAFMIWRNLGMIDTFVPLTLPAFLGGGAFNIFLLRQFFMSIPNELDEAMLIDGASYFTIWWRLILPLSKPALATVAIFSFIGNWDNFDGPLIYLNSPENYTVSVGLRLFQDSFGTNMGQLMAASLMHMAPTFLLFMCAQKFFVKGIAVSGLGGR